MAIFFAMKLSHNNIMQHCRYYSVHQLGKVGKDVGKIPHLRYRYCKCMSMLVDLLAGVGEGSVFGLMQLSHNINTVLVFWSVHQLG